MLKQLVKAEETEFYPQNAIDFSVLDLDAPVVFFTGENGSGKSTLLRTLSALTESINIGKVPRNPSPGIDYRNGFRVSWNRKLRKGYYFQSEDFYSFLTWAEHEEQINQDFLDETEQRHRNKQSIGYVLEKGLHEHNTRSMNHIVNEFMQASHGEGYIRFFASRLRSKTLYLLDEPETPLSFQNQLSLLKLIDSYVKEGSQFIICTHSPILLAFPNARIYLFDQDIQQISYNDHPLVSQYRSFLDHPDRYLYYLLQEE